MPLLRDRKVVRLTRWGPTAALLSQVIDLDEFTIGRASSNAVMVEDSQVSRQHLRLRRGPAGWRIVELGSRHGTTVDGRPLRGEAPIASGTRLQIGRTELVFELVAADVGSTGSLHVSADAEALVGESPAMQAVRATLRRVADAAVPVLLLGESGSGKEIAARLLHRLSRRADKPYVVVNCPALPGHLIEAELFGIDRHVATGVDARRGRLEQADGGTIFLDELGDLDLGAQAKLLRFLQDRTLERIGGHKPVTVDARVIAATNHDLQADIAAGRFRLDLFYRLNTVVVVMPPLRERREDIPALVDHFLAIAGVRKQASAAALALLQRQDFPGNVRELAAMVARAALFSDGPEIGPEAFAAGPSALARAIDIPAALSVQVTANNAAAGETAADTEAAAQALLRRITAGESFWDIVHSPFLRRSLAAARVRRLIAVAFAEAGESYRKLAIRFGIEDFKEYKKFIDFLRHHDLRPKPAEHA